jgi:CelD/BcsL family acetyltransferase involved in cellulose biosynthesis
MQVSVISKIAELRRRVVEWQDLAADAVEPNPFYEPWMVLPALEAFGAAHIAFVCVHRRDGKLAALVPLQRAHSHRGMPARTLRSWRHRHCLLTVPLVRAGCALEALQAFFGAMRCQAAVLDFAYLPAEGAFHHALVDAISRNDLICAPAEGYTRALMRRANNADAYVKNVLSAETRRELRRQEKRLAALGRVQHRVLEPGDDVSRWIGEFLDLEASGWKGRRGSALACTAQNHRFAVEVFTRGFERGRLVMVGVDLNGKPIARYSAFTGGAGAFAFKTAYDEGLRRLAPGLLAEIDMLRALHAVPGLQWADSYTAPENSSITRFWKARRVVQRVALATNAWGELVLALSPLVRWARRRMRNIAWVPAAGRAILQRCSRVGRTLRWSGPASPSSPA